MPIGKIFRGSFADSYNLRSVVSSTSTNTLSVYSLFYSINTRNSSSLYSYSSILYTVPTGKIAKVFIDNFNLNYTFGFSLYATGIGASNWSLDTILSINPFAFGYYSRYDPSVYQGYSLYPTSYASYSVPRNYFSISFLNNYIVKIGSTSFGKALNSIGIFSDTNSFNIASSSALGPIVYNPSQNYYYSDNISRMDFVVRRNLESIIQSGVVSVASSFSSSVNNINYIEGIIITEGQTIAVNISKSFVYSMSLSPWSSYSSSFTSYGISIFQSATTEYSLLVIEDDA